MPITDKGWEAAPLSEGQRSRARELAVEPDYYYDTPEYDRVMDEFPSSQ